MNQIIASPPLGHNNLPAQESLPPDESLSLLLPIYPKAASFAPEKLYSSPYPSTLSAVTYFPSDNASQASAWAYNSCKTPDTFWHIHPMSSPISERQDATESTRRWSAYRECHNCKATSAPTMAVQSSQECCLRSPDFPDRKNAGELNKRKLWRNYGEIMGRLRKIILV